MHSFPDSHMNTDYVNEINLTLLLLDGIPDFCMYQFSKKIKST